MFKNSSSSFFVVNLDKLILTLDVALDSSPVTAYTALDSLCDEEHALCVDIYISCYSNACNNVSGLTPTTLIFKIWGIAAVGLLTNTLSYFFNSLLKQLFNSLIYL